MEHQMTNSTQTKFKNETKINQSVKTEQTIPIDSELIWPPYRTLTFVISGLQHLLRRRRIFPIEMHGKLQNGAKLRFLVRFSPEMSRSTQN
jgi:hypothetical protein